MKNKNKGWKKLTTGFASLFLLLFAGMACFFAHQALAIGEEAGPEKVSANVKTRWAEDSVHDKNIKTIRLYRLGFEQSYPFIELNSGDQLLLSFDDLDNEVKTYSYTVEHCNADWQRSLLPEVEYLEGFYTNDITDYSFSFGALQQYVHYEETVPNNNMRITRSGNYILKVFKNNDPAQVVFTRRFTVVTSKVRIDGIVEAPANPKFRFTHQAVNFTVNLGKYKVNNPFEDIKVVITQNGRWNSAIAGLKPRFFRNNELIYDLQSGNIFPGGKEFRYFDIRTVTRRSERVELIERGSNFYVYLYPDEIRAYQAYLLYEDLNGGYTIGNSEGGSLESEYAYVHFSLPMNTPLQNGKLYVVGDYCAWQTTDVNEMLYNAEKGEYQLRLYLKQGYYNYYYAFVQDGQQDLNTGVIEGNSYETENNYLIYIYARPLGENHDELIGVKVINSMQQQ